MSEVDRSVQDRLQELGDFLGKQRVKVNYMARPDFDTAHIHEVYVGLLRAATSGRQSDETFRRDKRDRVETGVRRQELFRRDDAREHDAAPR